MIRTLPFILAAASLTLAPSAEAKDYVASIGARVTSSPPYEGADHNVSRVAPTISLRPADRPYRFTPPDGGATIALFDSEHFSLGPIVRIRYERRTTGDLAGLNPIKWAAEPGVFAEVWPVGWLRTRGEVRRGVNGHQGLVADVAADLIHTGKRWDFSAGPRVGWGDDRYIDKYFRVTAAEAARSPLVSGPYAPTAGRRYAGVEFAAAYRLTKRWQIKGDIGYRKLAKKAADSPIVRVAGGDTQWLGSLGLSYSFNLGL